MIGKKAPLETAARLEPCRLEPLPSKVADRAAELAAAGAVLGSRLHPTTARSLAELVRLMNCYYSNLIEGHNTRPRDIERALADHFDEGDRRNLQLEARAHVRVQAAIDEQCATGTLPSPTSSQFLRWVHREFYRDAPASFLSIENGKRSFSMVPGEYRSKPEHDVVVGRHHPPSSARVEEFMSYFERHFALARMGAAERIVAFAIAHHRLNYIHPFPDGNGRVSRLMSHAMALVSGFGAHGLWSISRGLARGLSDRGEYKSMMDLADTPRQGDLDGRGNLSRKALEEYVTWFLDVALDQVRFMSDLFSWEQLGERLQGYVLGDLGLREEACAFATALYARGEIARGDVPAIMGLKERTARSLLAELVAAELVGSATPKGPVFLRFTTASADALFPRLFLGRA